MLKKLSKKDHDALMNYIGEEPAINLFIIGDVESFGYDEPFQELWGDFDGTLIKGVLLRYRDSFVPYFKDASCADILGMKEIIRTYEGPKIISGAKKVLVHFEGLLPENVTKELYFCEIQNRAQLTTLASNLSRVKKAVVEDALRISNLLQMISEFSGTSTTVETIEHKLATNTGRIFYIENDHGEMLALAQTTAENSKSAMIVGVATHPDHRNKGYTSECMTALCTEVLNEGLSLCLFYDNPKAGNIYHRLGFVTIDSWVMIKPA